MNISKASRRDEGAWKRKKWMYFLWYFHYYSLFLRWKTRGSKRVGSKLSPETWWSFSGKIYRFMAAGNKETFWGTRPTGGNQNYASHRAEVITKLVKYPHTRVLFMTSSVFPQCEKSQTKLLYFIKYELFLHLDISAVNWKLDRRW